MLDFDLACRRLAAADPVAFDALLSALELATGEWRNDWPSRPCYPTIVGQVRGKLEIARMEAMRERTHEVRLGTAMEVAHG